MSSIVGTGIRLEAARHARRFERATADPLGAQTNVLRRLLRRNAGTVFGREHHFDRISDPAAYARRVPVRDYEGHRAYIDRAVAGEPGVLTAEALTMLTLTSGTTAEPKRVPVTARFCEEQAALTRLWLFHALAHHPSAFDGKVLMVASPAVEGFTASRVPFGSMSGVAYRRIPRALRRHYVVPPAVSLITDPEQRYFVTMRLALAADVTAVATPNATTLLRLAEVGSRRADELIRAVHDGTIGVSALAFSETADMTPRDAMEEIRASLRPDPARARVLARVLHEHGTLDPQHCWPNLAFIGCWLGGSAGLHAAHLRHAFGTRTPQRDLGLIASEGRMTVPLADATAAGPLAIATNFYEFVAEETIDDPAPPVLLAHELEDGRRYYVILTAGNGLYRYDINDIVEVKGFHARTPKVAFVRKGREMVDVAGEKLHLDQIQAALHEAERAAGIELWQYRIIPDVSQRVHDVLIEPTAATADVVQRDGQPFLTAFDAALMRGNIEYAGKRTSGRLAAPRLHVMPTGWSERECRRDFENGKREVQHKWRAIGDAWDDASRRAVIAKHDIATQEGPSPAGLPAAADRRSVQPSGRRKPL
jgi:hypothetical protein